MEPRGALKMKWSYGPDGDLVNIQLVEDIPAGSIVEDVRIVRPGAEIYLGFSRQGHLLEIEILGASQLFDRSVLDSMEVMDESEVPPEEPGESE